MLLTWRDGIYACEFGRRTILLDLASGRYRQVGAIASAAIRHLGCGDEPSEEERQALHALIVAGLLVRGRSREATLSPAPPRAELAPNTRIVRLVDVLAACAAQLVARAALRLLGFRRMHALLRSRTRSSRCDQNHEAIAKIAAAIERSDVLFSRMDRCLARSLAFRLLATVRGHDVRLVLGVRCKPFSAHCWIERDGVVLNDELDIVRQYAPLLGV